MGLQQADTFGGLLGIVGATVRLIGVHIIGVVGALLIAPRGGKGQAGGPQGGAVFISLDFFQKKKYVVFSSIDLQKFYCEFYSSGTFCVWLSLLWESLSVCGFW